MDVIDEAQRRNEHFQSLAMQNRLFDLPPLPPRNVSKSGDPLGVDCDANITKRRAVIASAQRCIDCQTDHERRRR